MAISVGSKAPDFTLKSKQASGLVDVKLSNNLTAAVQRKRTPLVGADGHTVRGIERHVTIRAANLAQLPPGEPANVLGVECSSTYVAQRQDAPCPLNEFPVQCRYLVEH